MYRVLKSGGIGANVAIENTDTRATVIIGARITEIINTIVKNGYEAPDPYGIWNIEVNKETAEELAKLTMQMKKPIRDQSKKAKDLFKKPNKEIDAMDVLLGLANYN